MVGATVGAVVGATVCCAVRCGAFVRSSAGFRSPPPRSARTASTSTRIPGTIARRHGKEPRALGVTAMTAAAAPPALAGATMGCVIGGGGATRATGATKSDGETNGETGETGASASGTVATIGGCDGLCAGDANAAIPPDVGGIEYCDP